MLKEHFDAVERRLIATSQIPANSGHTLHRGTPREAFIREFLTGHLSERVAVSTGEIIDSNSAPRERRNQFDLVIYRRDYPKLDFGGGINAFLAESVVATIEIKSVLDRGGINQSVTAASNAKVLNRNFVNAFTAGYQPPSILNYVVAYDGPARMETVRDWISAAQREAGVDEPALPPTGAGRASVASPGLDGVFVLGKGYWYFDNTPMGLINDAVRAAHPELRWVYADTPENNLLLLFLFLTNAVSGVSGSWLNALPYLENINFGDVSWAGHSPPA
jgi:hypothetical protein